jgi:Lrp/AsnC family transcriptional regulator, regulator for asnA, asnC and gidA
VQWESSSSADTAHARADVTDSKIISLLQSDGRMPYREIARQIDVSEATVRSRVHRLQTDGVLTIAAIADPFKLGYTVMAFSLLRTQLVRQQAVIDELTSWEEVTYISSCTGRANIYVQFACNGHHHLWELLSERLPSLDGVIEAETFQELKMHKVSYTYPGLGRGTT